jgi:hypothetical protein
MPDMFWGYEDDFVEAEDEPCFHCDGDGWDECHNRLECMQVHNRFGECFCRACGGSGLAKDMKTW